MNLLERKNFWICLLLDLLTGGLFTFYIAKKIRAYNKKSWYYKGYIWLFSFALGFLLGVSGSVVIGIVYGLTFWFFLFMLFYIQVGVQVSRKLGVPLDNFYGYPYVWLLSLIVPIFGWTLFIVLDIYVHYWYIFYLKRGNGEVFIR